MTYEWDDDDKQSYQDTLSRLSVEIEDEGEFAEICDLLANDGDCNKVVASNPEECARINLKTAKLKRQVNDQNMDPFVRSMRDHIAREDGMTKGQATAKMRKMLNRPDKNIWG